MTKLVSKNISGNLHEATKALNDLGVWDIVAMDYSPCSTVVVYRVTDEEYAKIQEERERAVKRLIRGKVRSEG